MKITGLAWVMIVIFVILVLLTFIYCCLKINNMYEGKNKK